MSQLERLVFSENFVKEESETDDFKTRRKRLVFAFLFFCTNNYNLLFASVPRLGLADKQQNFARHFGQGNIYDTSDRRGIAVDLLILFRDIHPRVRFLFKKYLLLQRRELKNILKHSRCVSGLILGKNLAFSYRYCAFLCAGPC